MADWTKPFEAAYRFVRVDRLTGYETETLEGFENGTLSINQDTQTFESAQADTAAFMDLGADLVRCYLDATFYDGADESVCLGTWLLNIPSADIDGEVESCAAYLDGRLAELQDDGFDAPIVVPSGTNIVELARGIAEGAGLSVRATPNEKELGAAWQFGFSDSGEGSGGAKLDAVNELMGLVGYASARTDPYGVVIMGKAQNAAEDAPVWTFREGEGATFLAKAKRERDTRDVKNVVHAIYETDEKTVIGEAVDDDPTSPFSTVSLGRRNVANYQYRDEATQAEADAKAAELLATAQSVIRRVTLRHVYCPARVGDVVAVEWPTAGISGRYVIRTQSVAIGSAGCLTTSELRAFERRANA